VLIVDDVDLIIAAVEDVSEGILQQHEEKQEMMYDIIKAELKGVHKLSIRSAQCLLCCHHQKVYNWGVSPPNYIDYHMPQRIDFVESRRKKSRP
jgi:hypothetical protein